MQPSSASIEHPVVRQWSFRARLTVLPPGWAPKADGSGDGGSSKSDGLRSGSAATRAAAAAGAQVFSAKNAAGAAAGGALVDPKPSSLRARDLVLSGSCSFNAL